MSKEETYCQEDIDAMQFVINAANSKIGELEGALREIAGGETKPVGVGETSPHGCIVQTPIAQFASKALAPDGGEKGQLSNCVVGGQLWDGKKFVPESKPVCKTCKGSRIKNVRPCLNKTGCFDCVFGNNHTHNGEWCIEGVIQTSCPNCAGGGGDEEEKEGKETI